MPGFEIELGEEKTGMSDQRMRSRLDLLDSKLADQVWSIKNDATLRLFACQCAFFALTHCGDGDPRSLKAVVVARRYAKGLASDNELNRAYADAERAAEAADEVAFDARDALEEGRMPTNEYNEAFGAARAAFSARDCCRQPAIEAANEAAYEAWAALRTAVEDGSTLDGLVSPDLPDAAVDAAIVAVLRNILEELE
jgi:hypothetical protein